MSPIPLAVFTLYPYLKRFTPLCHFGVGRALALAPLAGYAVAHPGPAGPRRRCWLAGFALAWVSGFDIIYATLDEASDRHTAALDGGLAGARAVRCGSSAVLHLIAIRPCSRPALAVLGAEPPGWPALVLVGAFSRWPGSLLFLEQRWAEDVHLAFFKVNVWRGCRGAGGRARRPVRQRSGH